LSRPDISGLCASCWRVLLREFREILPPTISFFIGFNLIVLTTNLLLANYGAQFASFMIATASALIIAKALLVAKRDDGNPPLRPRPADPADPVQNNFIARPS